MKRHWFISLVAFGFIVMVGYGVWIYLTEFYYRRSPYAFGVENQTTEIIRNGKLQLVPQGTDSFGALAAGQRDWYEDPHWPVPENFLLSFESVEGRKHSLILPSGVGKDFKGRLLIVIQKKGDEYKVEVQKIPGKLSK